MIPNGFVFLNILRQVMTIKQISITYLGFNPCFNGSCSRILWKSPTHISRSSFNPCFNGSCSRISYTKYFFPLYSVVSILVLMDLALELYFACIVCIVHGGFNPCFNGSCSRIKFSKAKKQDCYQSFNPCFNGSCSRIGSR